MNFLSILKKITKLILKKLNLYEFFLDINQFLKWKKTLYDTPSPQFIKKKILLRNSIKNGQWIETGTYLGVTTSFLLSLGHQVYSIEPEENLFKQAKIKFSSVENIKILNGTSEKILPSLLPKLQGDINFWLDGHFSAGPTFQGSIDCPIEYELSAIQENLKKFSKVSIMIDDVICYLKQNKKYAK